MHVTHSSSTIQNGGIVVGLDTPQVTSALSPTPPLHQNLDDIEAGTMETSTASSAIEVAVAQPTEKLP